MSTDVKEKNSTVNPDLIAKARRLAQYFKKEEETVVKPKAAPVSAAPAVEAKAQPDAPAAPADKKRGPGRPTKAEAAAAAPATRPKAKAKAKPKATAAPTSDKRGPGRPKKAVETTPEPTPQEEVVAPVAEVAAPVAATPAPEPVAAAPAAEKRGPGRPKKTADAPVAAAPEAPAAPEAKRPAPRTKAATAPKIIAPAAAAEEPAAPVEVNPQDERMEINAKGELVVFSTKEYSRFKFSDENRDPKNKHVNALADAIRKKNLLKSFPIIVNSKMEIMDGQHRFLAAQLLDIPFYYMIDDDFKTADIGDVNTSSENWQLEDYLKHNISQGKMDYVTLMNFAKDNNVQLHAAIGLLYGRTAQPNSDLIDRFKNGAFEVRDREGANLVVVMRNDFAKFSRDFWKSRTFLNVVSRLKNTPEYNHSRMIEQIEKNPMEFKKCNTIDQYLEMMSYIFGYKSKSHKVDFLARSKESMKKLSMELEMENA